MISPGNLLRPKAGHESSKVAFVELFFDLVFVFAITQLSHSLIGDFSATGAIQTGMLLLAVWWVWIFTAWVTNWLDPEKLPVRIALFAMMVVGLVLSAAIPEAFDSRGPAFAGAYVAMQVGRTLFVLRAVKGQPGLVRTFQGILFWFALGSVFWIAGACLSGSARMACWGLALAIEYASPSLGFHTPGLGTSVSTDWDISGHHIAERCGLFIIIAVLSIFPTLTYFRWRKAVRSGGTLPDAADVKKTRKLVMIQAHLIALIPLVAVFLARGFGARG